MASERRKKYKELVSEQSLRGGRCSQSLQKGTVWRHYLWTLISTPRLLVESLLKSKVAQPKGLDSDVAILRVISSPGNLHSRGERIKSVSESRRRPSSL